MIGKCAFWPWIILTGLRAHAQYRTGRAAWWLGMRLLARGWFSADWAHDLAIPLMRWTYWRPRWTEFATNVDDGG